MRRGAWRRGAWVLVYGAALGTLLASCAGTRPNERIVRADNFTLAPDVARLHDLWVGTERACVPVKVPQAGPPDPNKHWTCETSDWSSVTLTTGPDGSSAQNLSAVIDDSSRCQLERFAEEAVVNDSMQAAIVSNVTAELVSGPFAGACASLNYWYDRQRCEVAIFLPKERQPGSQRGACSLF